MSHVESQSTAEKDAAENGSESMAALLNDMRSASNITLLRTAEDIVRDKLAESTLLDVANEERVSKFDIHDLKLGRIIGRGAFCCVHEVRSLGSALSVGTKQSSSVASITRMIHNPFSRRASLQDGRDSSTVQSIGNESDPFSNTSFHVQVDSVVVDTGKDFTLFDKSKKYAVKRLDAECMDKIMFLKGVVGLAMEAKFLAALNHVNVIKLYGVSTDGPFADNFFLLLERMDETLTKRIKKWMDIERQCQGITGVFTGSKRKLKEVRSEQMLSAFEIAKGTSHLHQKGIIFRDLKPDNCGFNASGVLKLFDFGLARELKESERLKDGTYKMTGFTGALRYMAPEVGLHRPYNLKADVYSWAMILWYILALEPPLASFSKRMIEERVFRKGYRPKVFSRWSSRVSSAIQQAWDADHMARPTMKEVATVIRAELALINPKFAVLIDNSTN